MPTLLRVTNVINPCTHCRSGSMIAESDRDAPEGFVWTCLSCARSAPAGTFPTPPPRKDRTTMTAPTSPAPPPIGNPDSRTDKPRVTAAPIPTAPTPASATPHWTEAALAELRFDLDLLAKMDDLRAKVTRTHAALTTYGITDLPPLPWKGKPKK